MAPPITFLGTTGFSGTTLYAPEAMPVPRADIAKADVSGYDLWTTLSGVNKNSPTATTALINASYARLCELFWTFNGFTTSGTGPATTVSVGTDMSDRSADNSFTDEDSQTSGPDIVTSTFNLDLLNNCYRMYNGVTTDEDNFVGYGLGGDPNGSGPVVNLGNAFVWIQVNSVDIEAYLTAFSPNNADGALANYTSDYIVMDGKYHFALIAGDEDSGPTINSTTSLSVTASVAIADLDVSGFAYNTA